MAVRPPGRSRRSDSVQVHVALEEPPRKKRRYVSEVPVRGGRGRSAGAEKEQVANEVEAEEESADTDAHALERVDTLDLAKANQMLGDDGHAAPARRSAPVGRPRRDRSGRHGRQPATPRMRYSNAAAAAAASQASDYKPREEKSYTEFHENLEFYIGLPIFTADEVDGRTTKKDLKITLNDGKGLPNGDVEMTDADTAAEPAENVVTPVKRKPGRPPRRPESMLHGLGSPPAPRIMPLPTHNPKERLNLPKPSFRQFNHFLQYEEDQKENKINYVDRGMANIGYQESDRFELPGKVLVRYNEANQVEDEAEVSLRLESDGPAEVIAGVQVVGRVEYDMDEQDVAWLEEINEQRKTESLEAIKPSVFEITMTQIEKEYHALEKRIPKAQPRHAQMHRPRSSSQAAVNGDPNPAGDEPDSKCAICDDGDCENANAIIFCDGCDLAVHQECYGVPFIPEGQWFCRKCKEIGRGTPTCIFCPNVDGAFKQTSTLRWSHLLCAIWIPEITIANMTFMEPITDVDKVPKSRWKLHCYICNQKMGACIQCGNKNCYQAFHVTCARKAKLFLKMKSPHQQGIDQSALKAFCDKHVPPDWRRTHDTDHAIVEAKRWYKHAMKDRKWADSQSAALELGAPPPPDGGLFIEDQQDDTIAVTKKRRSPTTKMNWRLPSGAPVIPAVVFNTVEASLARFSVRKRKEFVEKACRYWTLKREARRGAALLKRLQLQLETFSSMEITRRSFASMGAVGRPRLLRRIDFAEMLQEEMRHLTQLCAQTRERENLRLREVEVLRELVDTVYFPIPALLVPIMQKARKLDEKTLYFKEGFDELALQVHERFFTSVSDFSQELTRVVGKRLASDAVADPDLETMRDQLNESRTSAHHQTLTAEQKEIKKLAKRILRAVKDPLEDAMRKEADLKGKEREEELRKLDSMGIFAGVSNPADGDESPVKKGAKRRSASDVSAAAGASLDDEDVEMEDADDADDDVIRLKVSGKNGTIPSNNNGKKKSTSGRTSSRNLTEAPPSPPLSAEAVSVTNNAEDVFAHGGIPWYLKPFDLDGTTVHEERYTGREVLRAMSEELSDMDEVTLTELGVVGAGDAGANGGGSGKRHATRAKGLVEAGAEVEEEEDTAQVQKKGKKRGKSNQWSRPRRIR